jgi:hypothetical protein
VVAEGIGGGSRGVAFLVGAGIVAELIAKACSSPQTVEINIGTRADTLMKWVNIGLLEGVAFVVAAAVMDDKYRGYLLAGGFAEVAVTWFEYHHAKRSGSAKGGPSTETTTAAPKHQHRPGLRGAWLGG